VNLSTGRCYQPVRAVPQRGTCTLNEHQRGGARSFSLDQIEALNRAFRQACDRMGLTGSTPVIELVAVRILELARAGEFDADKLTETVLAEFDL
jgi:hypothetical protein